MKTNTKSSSATKISSLVNDGSFAVTPKPPTVAMKETPAPAPVAPEPALTSIRDLSDKQLRDMRNNLSLEIKRRDMQAEALRPKKGEQVRIDAKGAFNGKVGVVYTTNKSRAFVEVEGIERPAYVRFTELTRLPVVAAEESDEG